jgi:hypothetical protein
MKDTLKKEFWDTIFEETDFKEYIEKKFKVGTMEMIAPDESTSIEEDEG